MLLLLWGCPATAVMSGPVELSSMIFSGMPSEFKVGGDPHTST
jgi:hypothetical protein